MAGVYLYCVASSSTLNDQNVASLDARPADGTDSPFRTVHFNDLAALVSDTEVHEFEIERAYLMAHHQVMEQVMALGDILPVSYGTVADSDEDIVRGLLEPQYEQLTGNLDYVRNRVELALRVMWDQEQLFREVVEEYDEIRDLRDALADVPEDQGFSDRLRLGELTSSVIEYKQELEHDAIVRALEPLSVDIEIKPSNSELLVLNGSFLVEREREAEFDAAVQEIAAPREGRMMFRYLGPLPPAHFVSVFVEPEG